MVTLATARVSARIVSSRYGLSRPSSRRPEPLKSSAFSVDMPLMKRAGPRIEAAGPGPRSGVARSSFAPLHSLPPAVRSRAVRFRAHAAASCSVSWESTISR